MVPAEKLEEIEEVYSWGVRSRRDLVAFARHAYRDYSLLAGEEPEGPAVIAALEAILHETQRWNGRPPISLPPPQELSLAVVEEVCSWAQDIKRLLEIITDLGNYCFFRLKKLHRLDPVRQAGEASHGNYRELKVKNTLLNNLEILLGRTTLASYPVKMEVDPTNDCNLSCRACLHGLTKSFYHSELRPEHIRRLSEALPFVEYLYLFGTGEPLMASSLVELVGVVGQYECKVDILTNGTRLSQAELPWGYISRLGVSVDGAEEETMRLLRPFARLSTVLAAIDAVRPKVPHATLYAKVTVSRMNLDELPAIVEALGQAGVNEVIFHSLLSFSEVHQRLQVRLTDRPLLQQHVEAARQVARNRGMAFVNAQSFDDAALDDAEDRNKPALYEWLRKLPVPPQDVPDASAIAEKLAKIRFSYYPKAVERAAAAIETLPEEAPAADPLPECTAETIDSLIIERVRQAGSMKSVPRIPYCFVPWKMPTVDPDARLRFCCSFSDQVADLEDSPRFSDAWNSPGYVQVRAAMFDIGQLPEKCRLCTSDNRSVLSNETLAVADLLGIPVREGPGYPAPVNIGELLRSEDRVYRRIEVMDAECRDPQRSYMLPPGGQVIVRFPNPRARASVYYQGKFRIAGGNLLVGIKPVGGHDMWNYVLDPRYIQLLGDWVGLPMPPMPLDFSCVEPAECCLFLWAPSDNRDAVELTVNEFAGLVLVLSGDAPDDLQVRHLWSPRL